MSQRSENHVVLRIAAFSDGNVGGNPAGVVVSADLPSDLTMQTMAAEVGYSETVFTAPYLDGWRARYFSPAAEVPFCGHATIALGAALSLKLGCKVDRLFLRGGTITVEGHHRGELIEAALQSPPTKSSSVDPALLAEALQLFSLTTRISTSNASGRPHNGRICILQGEDMGMRSVLRSEFSGISGSSVRVLGTTRMIPELGRQ